MSLQVAPDLLEKAREGSVSDAEFIGCIRGSLPYAWAMVERLVGELRTGGAQLATNERAPETDAERGQVLRMMASDAMRNAIQRHYGVRLAFQNCHRVAVFEPGAAGAHDRFTSTEAQLLNQSPALLNC